MSPWVPGWPEATPGRPLMYEARILHRDRVFGAPSSGEGACVQRSGPAAGVAGHPAADGLAGSRRAGMSAPAPFPVLTAPVSRSTAGTVGAGFKRSCTAALARLPLRPLDQRVRRPGAALGHHLAHQLRVL